jgi:hypothetical protein
VSVNWSRSVEKYDVPHRVTKQGCVQQKRIIPGTVTGSASADTPIVGFVCTLTYFVSVTFNFDICEKEEERRTNAIREGEWAASKNKKKYQVWFFFY